MSGTNHRFHRVWVVAAVVLLGWTGVAHAQDMEPRLYSNSPVGLNFAIASVSKSSGGLAVAAAIPIENANLDVTTPTLAFAHVFDAGGKSARFDMLLGGASLSGTADVNGAPVTREVSGMIDPVLRASVNLVGAPALSLREFQNYRQDIIVGANLVVVVPLGQYDPAKLINLGANRWIVQSEIGVSKALGPVTIEFGQAISVFSVNAEYLGRAHRSQAPVFTTKANIIYSFGSSISAAVQGLYFVGGQSSIDGVRQDDSLATWRIGATATLGLNRHLSIRIYGSDGLSVRTGTSYTTFGTGLQARWGAGL